MKLSSGIRGIGLVVSLVAGATVACGTSTEEDTGTGEGAATSSEIADAFDVNDVSLLFPIKGDAPYPAIRVSGVATPPAETAAAADQLWPKDVFDQVIKQATALGIRSGEGGEQDFFKLRGLWHIAAMRFDPCAPGFEDGILNALPGDQKGKCIVQLRLIAQPFEKGLGDTSADFSAHLVYNLGVVPKAELANNAVVKGATALLGQIKAASLRANATTAGQPLGVHPGLEAEAKRGGSEVASLVTTLIKNFTKTPSRSIAFMGLRNGGPEPWIFFAGQVANGQFTVSPGPVHGKTSQALTFIDPDGPVVPKGTGRATTTTLFTNENDLSDKQKELAFAVEDPTTTFFFNADCVSCHTSSSRTHDLSLGDGPEMARRTRVPANITGYVTKALSQDDSWNVRNFGYFGSKPTVSGRTATETVEVALWLNKNVRVPNAGINGPGPDCSAADDKVWRCFRDGKTNCLAACKPGPVPTSEVAERTPVAIADTPGDPCSDPTFGGAPTVTVQAASNGSVVASLGGNDSACLSRLLGGVFTSNGVIAGCASPSSCIISVPDSASGAAADTATITGPEATRLRQFFRRASGQAFKTRATDGGVQIECQDSSCTISVAKNPASLP